MKEKESPSRGPAAGFKKTYQSERKGSVHRIQKTEEPKGGGEGGSALLRIGRAINHWSWQSRGDRLTVCLVGRRRDLL